MKARPDTPQISLFIDSMNEAIKQTILALGGFQKVAAEIWPAKAVKDPIAAGRYLADCVNPERAQKLDCDEVLLIAKKGRAKGIHLIAAHFNDVLDYAPPQPVEPEDRIAQLESAFNDRVDALLEMAQDIKRLRRGSRVAG